MANDELPTINDFLARLYTIRDESAARAQEEANAIVAETRGLSRSRATLTSLMSLTEREFHSGVSEMFVVLWYMKCVPGIDYPACRDQAFLRARDLVPVLSGACNLEKWSGMAGRGAATDIIQKRLDSLYDKLNYRMRQFDVGLDEVAINRKEATTPTATPPAALTQSGDRASCPFQVALSFAGEQRAYVRDVAKALAARHIAVFYDEFEANTLWGKDGAEHFHQVFAQDSQYVVMFISAAYVAKSWTRHERRSAISRQMEAEAEYILPVRFDHTPVPGLATTLQYLDANHYSPAELGIEIAKKVGVLPTSGKASDVPPPASGSISGEVTFDYGAYNGRYIIGSGAMEFETCWSKASDTSIHLMNDPPSIHGVAVARGRTEFEQIDDASAYDFTSRSRTVRTGEIAVLRNVNGFFAAIKVVHVEDDTRGATSDALTIRYVILPDCEKNFTSRIGEATMA
jgi:hypothetical protein